eukprot:TsM_001028400 transcript=TsM_001028400 gene=TsM_001028400
MDGGSANITVNDVSKEEAGEIDLNTSFPLSRFRKGQSHVEVKFAVGGTNSESSVCALFTEIS